jgi:hypothetical protein
MPIGLTIPFSRSLPGRVPLPRDNLASEAGARGAQELGERIATTGDLVYEWQRRRDASALDDARAQREVWANQTIGDFQNKADDELSEIDPETKEIGFQKAGRQFADSWKQTVGTLGSRLSRQSREEFDRDSTISYERWKNSLTSGMIRREVEANQSLTRKRVSELAVSDPDEMYRYAQQNIPRWFPAQERGRQMDYAREQQIRHLIRVDPKLAIKVLEMDGSQVWDDDSSYDRLLAGANNTETAMKKTEAKAKADKMRERGRKVYRDIVNWKATDGKSGQEHSLLELGDLYAAEGIGKEVYDACLKILEGKSEPTQEEHLSAFRKVHQAKRLWREGNLDRDGFNAVVDENLSHLQTEDGERFIEDGESEKPKPLTNYEVLQNQAMDRVESMFDAWYSNSTGASPDEKEVAERLVTEGDFEKRLETAAKAAFPEAEKIDRNQFMGLAVDILLQMQRERTGATKEPEAKSKGWFLRGTPWYVPLQVAKAALAKAPEKDQDQEDSGKPKFMKTMTNNKTGKQYGWTGKQWVEMP